MDEEQLIARLKGGDTTAYRQLYDQFKDRVYNTALGILQNVEDAEDITQEVFVSVFQSIAQFKGEAKLSTWIYRIAVSRALEFIRKRKRKKRFAFIQSLSGSDSTHPIDKPHFNHPGVQLEDKERAGILFLAIEQLPENQKIAFVLHKVEGLNHMEISEIMNVSVSSIESLMHRAKQNLRKLLKDYYDKNEK